MIPFMLEGAGIVMNGRCCAYKYFGGINIVALNAVEKGISLKGRHMSRSNDLVHTWGYMFTISNP
jgi:hypothetical protein